MIRILTLAALLLPAVALAQSGHVSGRVLDAATNEGIPGATIRVDGSSRGAAADVNGRFHIALQPSDHILTVSAVGYSPERVMAHGGQALTVRLTPQTGALDIVTVDGARTVAGDPSVSTRTPSTTDDLMAHLPGVAMIQRANFAWEPVVRGYSGGQISLTVDGMPVYGACVDKMDPASSYVEPENLAAVEVSKGASDLTRGSQIGGAVDLVTRRPMFGQPVTFEAESGLESQGMARRVRGALGISQGPLALRLSGSYRGADDYAPGGGTAIPISGYQKRNLAAAAALRISEGHSLTAQLITDDAWLVGYPALLMDATLAQARIGSLTYDGNIAGLHHLAAKLYVNRVEHAMDDRFRDVMERPVMRGMYMPMAGTSTVVGAQFDTGKSFGLTHVMVNGDVHRQSQFGDMFMYSLFPGIRDMYLLNVGDARATNASLTLGAQRPLSSNLTLSTSARLDGSWRDTEREEIRSVFAARYGALDLNQTLVIPSATASLRYSVSANTSLRLTAADAGRLPSIVENYGHYVYNYVDGYFYTGRPDLKPERSRQIELSVAHARGGLALEASTFFHALSNVVVGVADSVVTPGLSGSTFRFRLYDNADRGWMTGGEVSSLLNMDFLATGLEAAASVTATYGQNVSFDEPLPMIQPLAGVVALRYDRRPWYLEAESRWAMPQNRVARIAATERKTDGFNVLALRLGWRPVGPFQVQAGVENLLDTRYREHLALSDLAARGRSIFASVGIQL